jgi:hypothetical protein
MSHLYALEGDSPDETRRLNGLPLGPPHNTTTAGDAIAYAAKWSTHRKLFATAAVFFFINTVLCLVLFMPGVLNSNIRRDGTIHWSIPDTADATINHGFDQRTYRVGLISSVVISGIYWLFYTQRAWFYAYYVQKHGQEAEAGKNASFRARSLTVQAFTVMGVTDAFALLLIAHATYMNDLSTFLVSCGSLTAGNIAGSLLFPTPRDTKKKSIPSGAIMLILAYSIGTCMPFVIAFINFLRTTGNSEFRTSFVYTTVIAFLCRVVGHVCLYIREQGRAADERRREFDEGRKKLHYDVGVINIETYVSTLDALLKLCVIWLAATIGLLYAPA